MKKKLAFAAAALAFAGPLVFVGATGTAHAICTDDPAFAANSGVPLCPPKGPDGLPINSNPGNGLPACTPGYPVQSRCNR